MKKSTYRSANASSAWYLQLFGYVMYMGFSIKKSLLSIPSLFYPDNPAEDSFFPWINTKLALLIVKYITPFGMLFNLLNTWRHIKKYYALPNKNLEKTLDLAVNILTTAASTLFFGFMLFGSAALILYVAPYLLIVATAVSAIFGLFNACKHFYRAYLANDKDSRKKHLLAAGKQLLGVVINALAFAVILFFGIKVNAQVANLSDNVFSNLGIMKVIGSIFKNTLPVIYILASCITLALIPSLTKKALELNKSPFKKSLQEIGANFVVNCQNLWKFAKKTHYIALPIIIIPLTLEIVELATNVLLRTAALLLTPFHKALSACQKKLSGPKPVSEEPNNNSSTKNLLDKFSRLPTSSQHHNEDKMTITTSATNAAPSPTITMCNSLLTRITLKLKTFSAANKNIIKKNLAKQTLLTDIKNHLQNGNINFDILNGLLEKAKKISTRVFQSFWRETGEIEEIVIAVEKYIVQNQPLNQNSMNNLPKKPEV